MNDDGRIIPRDGTAVGHLLVAATGSPAVGRAGVAEAAVIAIPQEKWQEQPLLVVVRKRGLEITKEALLGYLADKVPKWWLPDDVVFVEELPHTATGKLQKLKLREMFAGYRLGG